MTQTTAVSETAEEIIEYLQANGDGSRYRLTSEAPADLPGPVNKTRRLSFKEMEALLDEAGHIGQHRTDPSLKYDREDIYFDQ